MFIACLHETGSRCPWCGSTPTIRIGTTGTSASKRQLNHVSGDNYLDTYRAWQERDYAVIVAVADKIPNNVLEEDPKLLMWYDQAVTRMGGE